MIMIIAPFFSELTMSFIWDWMSGMLNYLGEEINKYFQCVMCGGSKQYSAPTVDQCQSIDTQPSCCISMVKVCLRFDDSSQPSLLKGLAWEEH